ncbi:hypothetical protein WJX72_003439 [[Myrmecia] bisecta]|uniref:ZZ-type domain-containing protein n=1 Tax=[Myrmecia] bisecta TaxID=41462 RepID=A0AAW1Q2W0_9CHLO
MAAASQTRNLQMLSAALHAEPDWSAVLFQGCGFVPDVRSLQSWLDLAWEAGFDPEGRQQVGRVTGTRKWIGVTDAAALLRYFGIRARIVDFETKGTAHECDACGAFPIRGSRYTSSVLPDYDLCEACWRLNRSPGAAPFLEVAQAAPISEAILSWVWAYFTEEGGQSIRAPGQEGGPMVTFAGRPPLFLQHQGHSRTIAGVVRTQLADRERLDLLVLDPSSRTSHLQHALEAQNKWQDLTLVSGDSLNKSHQILYVCPGIANPEEREQLKVMQATAWFQCREVQ